jgi:hypothetical protein
LILFLLPALRGAQHTETAAIAKSLVTLEIKEGQGGRKGEIKEVKGL